MSFQPGDRIGDYEVLQTLGAGGMGQVYKVRNLISDRVEAMKVLLPNLESDPGLADRFLREIKVQASLSHPNIASLYTAVRANNQLLMLMEFVDGITLEQLMHKGPVPLATALDAICQVLSALGYAHAHGVIHRDIKPPNMMLTPQGIVKLMDFGIARGSADHHLTQTGQTVGSLHYMSPEQIRGAEIDSRADLYSLGVSLYEVITGQRPFKGDSEYSIMAAHLQQSPAPPIEIDPTLPTELNEIMLLTIAKDVSQRFQSAEALRNALLRVLEDVKKGPKRIPTAVNIPAAHLPTVTAPAYIPPAPPPPPPPVMPAPVVATGSRRGLYMAAGSLATIAVLVFAGTQVPKWMHTNAAPQQQPLVQAPVTTSPPPQQQQPQTQPGEPAYATPAQNTVTTPQSRPHTSPVQERPQHPVDVTPQQPQSTPPVVVEQPKQAAPTPAPNAAELRELRQQLMLLSTRLGPVRDTLSRLEREQAKLGMGLNSDIKTTNNQAGYFMDEAESSIKSGDIAGAKKALERAEAQLERLESFIGRR